MLIDQNGNLKINNLITYPDKNYDLLRENALECSRCHLRAKCTQVVMGEGSLKNKIMFIGEGPGGTEDRQGRPFVGRAGQLLNKIFSVVGINRNQVYISNIIKCRPEGNRTPSKSEMEACSPILKAEIKIINPKVIVPLGSVALKYLVNENASITRSRGKWFKKGDYFFLPTFHPAYLLRNENMKKAAWYDFKKIKKAIGRIEELKKVGEL